MEQQGYLEIKKQRTNLVVGLVFALAIVSTLVYFTAGSQFELMVSDLSRIATVGAAVAMSFVVVIRQGFKGLFGRTYAALAVGLSLWLAAEAVWAYYELGQNSERPFPSIADALWIAGYAPFMYHLYGTSRFFGKGVKKFTVVIVIVAVSGFMVFSLNSIMSVFDLSDPESLVPLAISMMYPIFDAACVIPALLMVTNAGRGHLTSIPWIFLAVILFVVGDSLLGMTLVIEAAEVYPITMILNAGYLCIAAGLIWYNRMFITSERHLIK